MQHIDIFVVGCPVPKPRMTRSDKWKKRACVVEYRGWADSLRKQVLGDADSVIDDARVRSLSLCFYLPIPKSVSRKLEGSMHDRRPDIDNLAKSVLDALFVLDSRIGSLTLLKYFTRTGGRDGVKITSGDVFTPPLNIVSRLAAKDSEKP